MVTKNQLDGIRLWRAAEGHRESLKALGLNKREAQFRAAESIASGELPTQILPAVRRTVQTVYNDVPKVTDQFTTRRTVTQIDTDEEVNLLTFDDQGNIPDTNQGNKFVVGGLPDIGRREAYPQIGYTASGKKIRARKIGEAFGIDWEAIVNLRGANINLVREGFEAFGRHAGNQEEIDVFKLLVASGGFSSQVTTTGFNITGNPDVTDPVKLQSAIAQAMARQISVNGFSMDVNYGRFILLTTPANTGPAKQALGARRITRIPDRTGAGSAQRSAQWEETLEFSAEVDVVGSKWLKTIYPGIGNGWLLIPVADGDDLPVLTSNYLDGYEEPSVWIRDSNARRVDGGNVDPMVDGDFDSDAVKTKVRHVHGATFLWGDAIGYSTGANA